MSQHDKPPTWWLIFATEYLKNGQNGRLAYMTARPGVRKNSAEVGCHRLLRNVRFLRLFDTLKNKAEAKLEMSRDEWLRLLSDVARFDIRNYLKLESGSGDVQLVDDWNKRKDGHAIEAVKFTTTTLDSGAVVQRVELKRDSKLKALEIMGKSLGFLEEKVNVEHTGTIEVIDPYSKPDDKPKS